MNSFAVSSQSDQRKLHFPGKVDPQGWQSKLRIYIEILRATLPLLLNFECLALIGLVDIHLAGTLGCAAQAAVGLGDQLLFLTSTAATGLSVASCALTSRYFGSANEKRLLITVKASLLVGTICGIVAFILGTVASQSFVSMFSDDPLVIKYGVRYIQMCAPGSLPFVVSVIVSSIFRALGKAGHSMSLWLTTASISIALSFALFAQGSPLAGKLEALCLAWDIGAYSGLIVGLMVLHQQLRHLPKCSNGRQLRRFSKLLIVIGSAVVFAESSTFLSDFLIYKLLSGLDNATTLQAAWTIFMKVEETVAIMPLSALALALAATVGQMLGRNEPQAARRGTSTIVIFNAILCAAVGSIFFMFPHLLQSIVHVDAEVAKYTSQMFILMPIFLPLLAIRLLLFAHMEGSGQTAQPMRIAIMGNALKLLAAFLIANVLQFGLSGLMIALVASRLFLAAGSIKAFCGEPQR